MIERYETDLVRRYQAGTEAIKLIEESGFGVHDADVKVEDVQDCTFTVNLTLSVGELTRPLDSLKDDSDEAPGAEFALGLQAGMMVANSEPCDRDDCPRAD